ncbi:hypothetical protein SAMN05216226_11659 [Halovenus aranensis]|uniref:Sulfatase n=1 Tax=Halovenus aranensis TaxID=890420 RepID=A0A1G8YVJ8_9EURY|nr:hypothetical protein [Halovenus aranensis]SDK06848.1 hypothetical protein SAMN05216226_11659 [Halovenus aranensis]
MIINKENIRKGIQNPRQGVAFLANYLKRYYNPINLSETILSVGVNSRISRGTHVLECDWDLLIILDTCRVDAMERVAPEYEFIDEVDRVWSRGGSSPEWIAQTFDAEYRDILQNTALLTANPKSEVVLEDREYVPEKHTVHHKRLFRYGKWNLIEVEDLARYERLWKFEPREADGEAVHTATPPRVVTDRGIEAMRNGDYERVILHYMQPHYPYISNAITESRQLCDFEMKPSAMKKHGREKVYQAYLDDLRYVLSDVSLLLENVDAEKVVLSADHGDAFGEYWMYGHDPGRIHPDVRYVPWVETSAEDTGSYEPETEPVETKNVSTKDQLRDLGYL